jgi:Acetyltransferase (GNAT) family
MSRRRSEMEQLKMVRALAQPSEQSAEKFQQFLKDNDNPFVTPRTDAEIQSVLKEQNLFFVLDSEERVVATTAFYRHGDIDSWGELGSTVVNEKFRGLKLQSVMYRHIIALARMSDYPHHVFAVVDEGAGASFTNIENLGFERLESVPIGLGMATATRDWSRVAKGLKRLYRLGEKGLAGCLLYVAENGSTQKLAGKHGEVRFELSVEFKYLNHPYVAEALRREARNILASM